MMMEIITDEIRMVTVNEVKKIVNKTIIIKIKKKTKNKDDENVMIMMDEIKYAMVYIHCYCQVFTLKCLPSGEQSFIARVHLWRKKEKERRKR